MKTHKYKFYIGWNNQTHKREFKKAISVLNDLKVLGYSIAKDLNGFWNKEKENSFIIEIISTNENLINDNKAKQIKTKLENDLKQYLVLLIKENITIL